MFGGFQNTNNNIKTTARATQIFGGFQSQGLQSNLKLGRDGGVPETGLVARFRADTNITLNGSNVSAWSDFSNTYTLSQGTAANQPSYVTGRDASFFNFQPCIGFLGTTKSLNITNQFGPKTDGVRSVIAILYNVATAPNTTSYFAYFSSTAANSAGSYFIYSFDGSFGQYSLYFNPPTGTNVRPFQTNISIFSAQNTPHILGCEVNRTSGRFYSYYGSAALDNRTIVSTLTDYTNGTFSVINNSSTGGWYLAELLIYNTSIAEASLSDRRQLYYYVRNRYGSLY